MEENKNKTAELGTFWKDGAEGGTPLSADNLNAREEKIKEELGNSGAIVKGEGENSAQQPKDTENWGSGNAQVKRYITEKIGTADDGYTIAVDENNKVLVGAYGKNSTMMNGKSQTVGGKTHAEGSKTIAFESNAHAEGNDTFAAGKHSHSEGNKTSAIGNSAHAENVETEALAEGSHTEGYKTTVTEAGKYGHAEGSGTKVEAPNAHAEGVNTHVKSDGAHTEGMNTIVEASAEAAHAEGNKTVVTGFAAHAEGEETIAEGAMSHAEGKLTQAIGAVSHAGGYGTKAIGAQSHAEGSWTTASGDNSHAEGGNTTASGKNSHAGGNQTKATGENQTVIGRYNNVESDKAFIVGNGNKTEDGKEARSNALALDWNGNLKISGTFTDGSGNVLGASSDGGTWEKLADITTTEEVNSIIATAEEFPDIPKCKEFIIRGVFPKSPTGENISLGALRVDFNNTSGICFYFGSTTVNKDVVTENRVHSIIANKLVFSVGTQGASGQAAVSANAHTLIGERFLSGDVTQIIYRLNTASNVFPIGTKLYIYGKVEG